MKVFLNYRPAVTPPTLADRIRTALVSDRDIASVVLSAADPAAKVSDCDAFIALIGPGWAELEGAQGKLIDDPSDPVRIEVEAALNRIMPLLPVLIDDARLPEPTEINTALQGLTLREPIAIDSSDLERGCARLIGVLLPDRMSAEARTAPVRPLRRRAFGKGPAEAPTPLPPPPPRQTADAAHTHRNAPAPNTSPSLSASAVPPAAARPAGGTSAAAIARPGGYRRIVTRSLFIVLTVALVIGATIVLTNVMRVIGTMFQLLSTVPRWI